MNSSKIPNGTDVIVRHETGQEAGVVVSSTNGRVQQYTVRFADGTVSSWGAHRVTVAR
jgi:hypothetical protein